MLKKVFYNGLKVLKHPPECVQRGLFHEMSATCKVTISIIVAPSEHTIPE